MIGDWLLKAVLSKVGAHIPRQTFARLDSSLNYLNAGRWMSDHHFSPADSFKTRLDLLTFIATSLSHEQVLYLEFGVWRGETMELWSNLLKNPDSRLHGFDSFEGLPEKWDHHGTSDLARGHFSTQGKLPDIADTRVAFFKGWFEDTLPRYEPGEASVLVISIDADLYSSTSLILKCLRPHIKSGTVIYFDEFWDRQHEMKAFEEFLEVTDMRFELVAATYGMRNVVFKRIG